jgi:hypothetical protein
MRIKPPPKTQFGSVLLAERINALVKVSACGPPDFHGQIPTVGVRFPDIRLAVGDKPLAKVSLSRRY